MHGDLWASNILWRRRPGGSCACDIAAVIDWQLMHAGLLWLTAFAILVCRVHSLAAEKRGLERAWGALAAMVECRSLTVECSSRGWVYDVEGWSVAGGTVKYWKPEGG